MAIREAACLFPSAVLILPAHVGAGSDKGRGVRNAVFRARLCKRERFRTTIIGVGECVCVFCMF